MLGVGPGALASDAYMLGIDPARQREMMDESLGIIMRLFNETEPINYESDWFELHDAMLQLRPYQENFPVAVASVQSPAGVLLAGKHGTAVISLSVPRDLIRRTTLKDQWAIAEESAAEHGKTVDRNEWRLSVGCHLAETRKEAFEDIRVGSGRVVTEYFGNTLGHEVPEVAQDKIVDFMAENNQWIVGTPDDCIAGNRAAAGSQRRIRGAADPGGGLGAAGQDHEELRAAGEVRDAPVPGKPGGNRGIQPVGGAAQGRTAGEPQGGPGGCDEGVFVGTVLVHAAGNEWPECGRPGPPSRARADCFPRLV